MLTYIIVDDEPIVRAGILKKIEQQSLDLKCIGEASNGEEALRLINLSPPNILITDMHMPIMDGSSLLSDISQNHPEISILVISGYKDFEYAKKAVEAKAVEYILKPFSADELGGALKTAINHQTNQITIEVKLHTSEAEKEDLRENYDRQILFSHLFANNTDTSLTSEKFIQLNRQSYVIISLYCKELSGNEILIDSTKHDIDGLTVIYLGSNPQAPIHHLIMYFDTTIKTSRDNLIHQYDRVLSVLASDHMFIYTMGVSRNHHHIDTLYESRVESINALDMTQSTKGTQLYFYEPTSITAKGIQWDMEDTFLFRVESGNKIEVETLYEKLTDMLLNQTTHSLFDIKYYFEHLTGRLRLLTSKLMEQDVQSGSVSSISSMVQSMYDFDEIFRYMRNFVLNITGLLSDDNIYSGVDTIDQVKVYVERHYADTLSAEFVSSLFYINRTYLSYQFKKKHNIKYVDYVNQVRIHHAMKLLTGSTKKVYQISKAVGYDNVKYFYRVFKKMTGMTPNEYIQNASPKTDRIK